jgi:vacuolar protein sorting-associated protein 26
MSFLYPTPNVTIKFASNEALAQQCREFTSIDLPFFSGTDAVTGTISIDPPPGKSISHKGISVELFGEFRNDKDVPITRFFTRKQVLRPEGEFRELLPLDFKFENLNFPCSTYLGTAVNAVYGLELRVVRRLSDHVTQSNFVVALFHERPAAVPQHKEVGITNLLHVEFVFPELFYDVRDAVVGSVYLILIKLRLTEMSLILYRQETCEVDTVSIKQRTQLKRMEIMDGAPVKGDLIPIRFFLAESDMWPFQQFKGSVLKVEHYLRAEMIDENGKHYYKRMTLQFDRFLKPETASS